MPGEFKMFLRPLHVVHVEDCRTTQLAVGGILQASKYPEFVVHSFGTIAEAEKWMGGGLTDQLDCILLDLNLVETEGMDTFIHALSVFKSVPILVLTGTADIDLACQLIYHGAEACLIKDFGIGVSLSNFVAQSIARKSRPAVSAAQLREAVASLHGLHTRLRRRNEEARDNSAREGSK